MEYEKGDLVWFDPGLGYVLPGEVIEFHRAGQVITVQAVIGGKSQVFTLTNLSSVRRRQDLGQEGVSDMITISDLNEASLLWNLKIRYDKEQIYTYTGSILVSVNPYKMSDIYGLDAVKRYEGQILGTLPPHIFAVGSACYSRLSKDQRAQCVVISGESGAGKTEATKLIMQYLAAVNKSASNLVTEQILEASPLLESFGNAKTIKNDNSSRFGKYLEVFFRGGIITGARITEYLLEKSRIVTQASGERNYHVFYEMLAGLPAEAKAKYGLTQADKYFYLNQGGATGLATKEDSEDFSALLSALQVLGFSALEQDVLFRILATVLHLGNVYFHRKQMKHGQEAVEIGSKKEIKWAAHLLQIDSEGIVKALTTKSTEARNERLLSTLNIDQALDARDAVAKALYSALFSWLVRRTNQIICSTKPSSTNISILDIFGFESFKENSFEQLCINYANEKLQFYFNKHIFKLEQQEYAKERIEWQNIEYQDNQPVIELLSRKPVGVLHLLDDESNFPKATDVSFLEKCHYNHALNDLYSRPRLSSLEFGIQHFAGQVWYSVDGFLDKNRDTLRADVIELLISSKIKLVSEMFLDVRLGTEKQTLNKANGRFVTMKPRTPTVAARFHDSLTSLTDSMAKCNPWFIRCVKPNNEKAPLKLDMPCVLEQLRYSGMLETIKIRQQGFPVRLPFAQFADRYRCLVPGQVPRGAPSQEICRVVLQKAVYSPGAFQLGATKVFLKEALEKTLEQERYKKLSASVIIVQKCVRGYLARRRLQTSRSAATKIQAAVRMHQARRRYVTLRKGVVKAQALVKGRHTRRQYAKFKEERSRLKRAQAAAAARAAAAQTAAGGPAGVEEQQRVQQRAVAAVNHLEVPAELAFVFSKTKDWQNPHSDRHVTKAVNSSSAPVRPQSAHYPLPYDLDFYPFTKFTNVYFKSHLWGMKREPIRTPFLAKARDSDYADSLALFKLILRFMNDTTLAGNKETVLADYIANKGITNESLRDEILCQLCNQTWRNTNPINAERGWLLMANCLSVFSPSDTLYNYLLKYVTDNAPEGYASLCQHKLLSRQGRAEGGARTFPPCQLEWRANKRKAKMALEGFCPDGKSTMVEVDSWTTGAEFAAAVLQSRGIEGGSGGWSVALSEHDTLQELPGEECVLDLLAAREVPPAFPARQPVTLYSGPGPDGVHYPSPSTNGGLDSADGLSESPVVARRARSPPALTRKLSREALEVHDQVMTSAAHDGAPNAGGGGGGLSRSSALNSRYFDDKSKSRSLDNLMEPAPQDQIQDLGLSSSRLNERYHSVERLTETPVRGPDALNGTAGGPPLKGQSDVKENKAPMSLAASRAWSKNEELLKGDYPRAPSSTSSRYIKAPVGRRGPHGGGVGGTRAQIEREYMKSSAMSDTSEAPSLASHVRRVRVPSQASDVDQYLDDLFIPVLDHQMADDLSDARSLAASIKGGSSRPRTSQGRGRRHQGEDIGKDFIRGSRTSVKSFEKVEEESTSFEWFNSEETDLLDVDDNVMLARTRPGSFRRLSLLQSALEEALPIPEDLLGLTISEGLCRALKGGGAGAAEVDTQGASSAGNNGYYHRTPNNSHSSPVSPPLMPLNTMPLYSPGGLVLPGLTSHATPGVDPNNLMAYQQNLQRAYIQSAVAQNIQIQQHLMAQNQALQQLLTPNLPQSTMGLNMLGGLLPLSPAMGLPLSPPMGLPLSPPMGVTGPTAVPNVSLLARMPLSPTSPLETGHPPSSSSQMVMNHIGGTPGGTMMSPPQPPLLLANSSSTPTPSSATVTLDHHKTSSHQKHLTNIAKSSKTFRSDGAGRGYTNEYDDKNVTTSRSNNNYHHSHQPQQYKVGSDTYMMAQKKISSSSADSVGNSTGSKVSFQEPEHADLWSSEKAGNNHSTLNHMTSSSYTANHSSGGGVTVSPPPPLLPVGAVLPAGLSFSRAAAASSPLHDMEQQHHHQQQQQHHHHQQQSHHHHQQQQQHRYQHQNSNRSHESNSSHTRIPYDMHSPGSPPSSSLASPGAHNGVDGPPYQMGHVPPPPPMPTHLNQGEMSPGGYMDPYQRAKTVRIGKWRWPPPKEELDASFMHFKQLRQQHKKSPGDGRIDRSADESGAIEWEEFEVGGPSSNEASPRKDSQESNKDGHNNHHNHDKAYQQHQYHQYHQQMQQQLKSGGGGGGGGANTSNNNSRNQTHDADNIQRAFDAPVRIISRSSINYSRNQKMSQRGINGDMGPSSKEAQLGGGGKDGGAPRRRRDSWDNPVIEERSPQVNGQGMDVWDSSAMEEEKGGGGIGKLKISREMKEKLEALTSTHPVRGQKGSSKSGGPDHLKARGGVKKLEEHRRMVLQQQLAGDKWDTMDSSSGRRGGAPPPPVAPPTAGGVPSSRRPGSPALSASSLASSAMVPQPRSPPASIQPVIGFRGPAGGKMMPPFRTGERRGSVSTMPSEKPEQFEFEDSSEFLPSVDRGAPAPPGRRGEGKEVSSLLLPPPPGQHITYHKLPWRLHIRKEVFFPGETISGDALQLVFCQVVVDAFSGLTCRIQHPQRTQLRKLLDSHCITPNNCLSGHHSLSVRNEVVNMAKSWPLYFAALYPVTGSRRGGEGEMIAISHSGLRLARRDGRHLTVTNTYKLEDIEEVEAPRSGLLQVVVFSGGAGGGSQRLVLYTARARTLAAMIGQFASAAQPQGSRSYVRAVADYQTRESRLLSFNKGDIIRVTSPEHYQDKGWLEGSVDGRTGLFPMEYVVPIGRAEARRAHKSNEEDLDPELRSGGHRGLGTAGSGARGDREAGAGSGGSTSSWGHHHNSTITATTTSTNTTALHQSAVTSTTNNRLHHHQDDSGHSSGGEGGVGGGMSSGGEQRNGVGGETGGGSLGSLSKSPQPRDMLHHETMTSSQYSSSQFANDGKHSLLQFALKYFRMAKEQNLVAADGTLQTKDKSKKKKNSKDNAADWTWKEQVEMVKFTQSPLTASLLPLDLPTSQAAVEVFLCVMRYMGDYPMEAAQTEVPCVYTILTNCHLHEALRDELYCQLMKQTTSNKSSIPDSCQRGWRLFSIIAAYFTCSDILRPYLFKYLETNAYDKRRAFHGTATVCLQNLRKTFKYGGRKNVPSIDEITALTAGRNSKREIYRLPGGTERVINTRSTSVVQDILEEMCQEISVTTPEEQEEFSMYCLVEGEAFTMPLARDEYILDITTELRKNNQMFYLIFCRSVWYCPLRLDTPLYIEVVFNQMAPDYLEGLLLVLPGEKLPQHLVMDISRIAALMHRAADLDFEPTVPEVKYLLPKQALVVREVKPHQWIAMVQEAWPEAAKLTTTQAKAQVLELLQHWELFGSAFFTVKRVLEGQETVDIILALNKRGVHFLDYDTHETLEHYSLSQVFGTRKVKSEDGHLYLDMKFGNLLHHRISRIQTIQAHEISRLFRQYISTEQRVTGGHDGDAPRDVTLSR